MWLPSCLYYVVCPRTSKFMDYVPAMLREDLAREGTWLVTDGEMPLRTPLIEVTVLACRSIASVGGVLGPTEETIASVTLKDPQSGLVVGTAICIGLTSSSVMQDNSGTNLPAPTPRTRSRRPARGMARAKVSVSHAGKRALWADDSRPHRGYRGLSYSTDSEPREEAGYAGTLAVSVLTAPGNRSGHP